MGILTSPCPVYASYQLNQTLGSDQVSRLLLTHSSVENLDFLWFSTIVAFVSSHYAMSHEGTFENKGSQKFLSTFTYIFHMNFILYIRNLICIVKIPQCQTLPSTRNLPPLPVGEVGYETLPQIVTGFCHFMGQSKLQASYKGFKVCQLQGLPNLFIWVAVERI